MSGLPILIGGALLMYMINSEQGASKDNRDDSRRAKDADKTVTNRNKSVKSVKVVQDDPDTELHRDTKARGGNNTLSGQEGTSDSVPNEQTEPLPERVVEAEEPNFPHEPKKNAIPDNEYENGTLKDNGKIMKKSGVAGKIN